MKTFYILVGAVVAAVVGVIAHVPPRELDWDGHVVPMAQRFAGTDDDEAPLTGNIVVVTGATSGIGKSLTQKLSRLGARVVALGRSPRKLQNLRDEIPSIDTVEVDLVDLASVAAAARQVSERYTHIDILINNAGIHDGFSNMLGTSVSAQGYDQVFAVNYLSHFLLTELLTPKLLNSTKPTVAHVASS